MNSLTLRKRLLVLEAEVHREQLAGDWETTWAQLRAGGQQAKAFGSFAGITALCWTAINVVFTRRRGSAHPGPSGTGGPFPALKLAMALWPAWKAIRQKASPNPR